MPAAQITNTFRAGCTCDLTTMHLWCPPHLPPPPPHTHRPSLRLQEAEEEEDAEAEEAEAARLQAAQAAALAPDDYGLDEDTLAAAAERRSSAAAAGPRPAGGAGGVGGGRGVTVEAVTKDLSALTSGEGVVRLWPGREVAGCRD
jgi:hypothetical protein